ncbi:MAG: MFS transporter [Rhodobacteraceae bacterium]|nr:MFS transporter [Paracoccaceae bacterium]
MAFHVRHPVLITAGQPGAWTFSGLFFLESVARAALVTVLPLTVYAAFPSKETVSLVYTCVSLAALAVSFTIPPLVRALSRRWTYTLGAALVGLCALLVALGAGWALPLALLVRTSGAAMLNITLSLYIMDNIDRKDLVRSEPLRLGASTLAWSAGPFAGVWLMQRYGALAPSALSLAAVATLLAAFWTLRLAEGGPIRPGLPPKPARNPAHAIRRFAAQPRLRLAWAIAFARSSFWVTFFIYIPILMVEGGLGPTAAGLAVAAGNLMLFTNLFLRGVVARLSLRRVMGSALLAAGGLALVTGLSSLASPAAAAVAMVAAAFFVATLDGLGPIAFLRAVRAHERPAMTTVYRTYLDASELLPPLAYFFLFMAFGYPGAFAALAALLAVVGLLTLRHLPRGM